tara:strand:- start:1961 stop:2848 length:888 start_codon:yes stop_codon:yes gene_type:complete
MTIKQLGGVFGRNPTFNDVTIEGQLTFDGDIDINSDLKVDGDIEATGSVTADSLVIGTSSIDASGNLLLNTTNSPTTTEAIISSDYSAAGTTNTGLTITGRSSGNWYNNGIHALGTALAFSTATTGTTGADATNERMRIDSVGHAIIPSGVTLGTATGVYNAANTLDDYEEGDFSVTSPTAEVVLNANTCKYTKVGRKVTCSGAISVASIGTPTGNVDFGGFPFTSANVDGADISVDIYTYGWKTSMTTSVMGAMSRNAAGFFLQKTNGAGSVAVLSGDVQAGTVIWFSVSYIVA